jgi:hypothetical protein
MPGFTSPHTIEWTTLTDASLHIELYADQLTLKGASLPQLTWHLNNNTLPDSPDGGPLPTPID